MKTNQKHLLLFENEIGTIDSIELLKQGQNASVYKVVSKETNFVLRVGYKNKQTGSSLENAANVMRTLNAANYLHCAERIYFNEEEDILIETYIVGESKKLRDYSKLELTFFLEALVSLYNVPVLENANIPLVSRRKELDVFGTQRLDIVKKKLAEEKELIEWLENQLRMNFSLVEKQDIKNSKPHIVHGDIGGNLLVQSDKVSFFDWEYARLSFGHELEYIKIHSHPTPEQLTFLIKNFAQMMHLEESRVLEDIEREERVTRLNDVIWAAMRWGETKSVDFPEGNISHRGNTFKQLMINRKEIYQNFIKQC